MMKKISMLILLILGMHTTASAEKVLLFTINIADGSSGMQYWIDRDAMMFYFDSDSEDDATMKIQNYKKNGNKETFEIIQANSGTKMGSIEIVIDPTLKIAQGMDLTKQTMKMNLKYDKNKYCVLHGEKQYNEYYKKGGNNTGDSSKNPVDKAKNKAKNMLNKGKKLFKKK